MNLKKSRISCIITYNTYLNNNKKGPLVKGGWILPKAKDWGIPI